MNKLESLKWQLEMGADEALELQPIDRTVKKPSEITQSIKMLESSTKNQFAESQAPMIKQTAALPQNISAPIELEKKARKIADNCNTREELIEAIKNFDGLAIKKTATNTVFSDGNPNSKVMLIGEAPGANEDIQGIPFCGASGKLMDSLLNHARFFRDKNIYISNTVFWRPPGNRTPTPEELAICRPFVEKHIALINPEILGLVGGTATFSLLNSTVSVSKLRTKSHTYSNAYMKKEVPVFVFFHPSYLLRQPSQKKTFWFDVLRMKKHLSDKNLF